MITQIIIVATLELLVDESNYLLPRSMRPVFLSFFVVALAGCSVG